MLTTRLFIAPLTGGFLLGWTSTAGTAVSGHVSLINNWAIAWTRDFSGLAVRGLAATPALDGSFVVLLHVPNPDPHIYARRVDSSGSQTWQIELMNRDPASWIPNKPTDFGIGDSRLEGGGGVYRAYYHVHSDSGHEGDTLHEITDAGVNRTIWIWGCSHSMSNLLRYHANLGTIISACCSDAYPGHGVWFDHTNKVADAAGAENGNVAAELGGIAPLGNDSFAMVYNSHRGSGSSYDPGSHAQDISFATIKQSTRTVEVTWLTADSVDQEDSCIARLGTGAIRYLVGWREKVSRRVFLSVVNSNGGIIEGPTDATGQTDWGARDDSFRTLPTGDVIWAVAPSDTGNQVTFTVTSYNGGVTPFSGSINSGNNPGSKLSGGAIAALVICLGVLPICAILIVGFGLLRRKQGKPIIPESVRQIPGKVREIPGKIRSLGGGGGGTAPKHPPAPLAQAEAPPARAAPPPPRPIPSSRPLPPPRQPAAAPPSRPLPRAAPPPPRRV